MEEYIITLGNTNLRSTPVISSTNIITSLPGDTVLKVCQHVEGTTWDFAQVVDGPSLTLGYITTKPQYVTPTIPDYATTANNIITYGEKYLGVHYVWGSYTSTDNSFDCSDFTKWNFLHAAGIILPRLAGKQAESGVAVSTGYEVLRSGDLLFFDTDGNGTPNHVAMYVYPNLILHTYNTTCSIYDSNLNIIRVGGGGVTYSRYDDTTYWRHHTTGARRFF